MILSVQNNNLMFSVEFLADLLQIQVRETVCGVFVARLDISIQVWHMVGGSDAQGFQRLSYNASNPYREPTWRNANDGGSDRACGNELPRNS